MSGDDRDEEARRLAVALKWDHEGAPVVVAKGRGATAEAIVAAAETHGVAVEENPILAAALAQVELDAEIPEQLYKAVAEVIAFVLRSAASR
ncbi:MAG: EscU/YscU/HrcU family type III secretion system export apparatus switch protein [Siculibacillus sp.]|nr:EscU/YscU/HrcU family type III secretion system export apparatus switch protein [Siculibacillus sp.]